jgi:3-(3-hydroxy-phenyl)propionate hydroxylase
VSGVQPVLIVGGGPVGLCAALHLAQLGIPFTLLEDDDALSTAPKAGTILPSSLEIFAQLGIVDQILGAGVRCPTIDFLDRRSGRVVSQMHVHELASDTRFPVLLNLAQSETERVLFDALVARGFGDSVRFGHRVTAVEQDASGCRVSVQAPGGSQVFEGAYMIGCDGGRSGVREQLGIQSIGRTYPETFMLFNVSFRDEIADGERLPLTFVFDPDEWMIIVRLPEFWRVVWPLSRDEDEPSESDLRERIRFAFGGDHAFDVVGRARYNVHHRYAEAFRSGRAFLAGDSAHLMTPVGGLGLNTGLQDVNNLAWKLAWVLRGDAHEDLLDSYGAERQPVAKFITGNLADRNRELLMLRHPLKRLARNVALAAQRRSRRHRWTAAHTRSLLATKHGAPAAPPPSRATALRRALVPDALPPVRRGDFAPDGALRWPDGHVGTLHELIGSRFVAITFADGRRAERRRELTALAIDDYVVSGVDVAPTSASRRRLLLDLGNQLKQRYGAALGTTYVIRPDGFVLDVVAPDEPAARVQRALEGIGVRAGRQRPPAGQAYRARTPLRDGTA